MLSKFLFHTKSAFTTSAERFSTNVTQTALRTPWAQKPGAGEIRNVTLVPGSGIGPEVTNAVQRVFEAAKCPINWDILSDIKTADDCRIAAQCGTIKKNDTLLLGMLSKGDKGQGKYKDSTYIYKELECFANLTYAKTVPNINTRHKNIDIIVIRENTEGEYSGVEHEVYPGVVESIKVITKEASDKVANYAFEHAYVSGRRKVTAVHKANIMKLCDGLFLESCRAVAKKYPHLQYEEMIIDNTCMQLVKNPWKFDVMVMPNLYGSIVSNTVAGLVGGPGMTCGANIGDNYSLFEQGTRHSGADIAGKGLANPTSLILSAVMMLKHLGLPRFASDIERAVDKTFGDGKVRTKDVGGRNTTDEFVDEIIRNLANI